jgi:DNA-binding IclR family transcriptional regulator
MSNNMATGEKSGGSSLHSVERALNLLEVLAQWGEGGVTELAVELDVHKSTIFRLLGALESRGLVDQTEDRGKYRLGFGLVRLAGAVSARMDITSQARPVASSLSNDIGETVNIAVLNEHHAVNVEQALGPASVSAQNWVGRQTPLHATASGKVLLAHVAPGERARLMKATKLVTFTERTVTTAGELGRELETIVDRGYATTEGEYEEGLNAIAVPVRDAQGSVVAALSASGPSYRFTLDRMEELVPSVQDAGEQISRRLGHIGN